MLFHFSEDPTIERFVPHVPVTNPTQPPAVWAIDAAHAPLYWFPRACPRVAVWPWPHEDPADFRRAWATTSDRVHVIETGWLDRMRTAMVYRYSFDGGPFQRWTDATGHWVCDSTVEPIAVEAMTDLLGSHERADIDLRTVHDLWPVIDTAVSDAWDFSIVRKANALPRR